MTDAFGGAWWSIELPDGWVGDQDDDCATIVSPEKIGALQISAYKNEETAVTEEDLQAFAEERLDASAVTEPVSLGTFDGLTIDYAESDEEGDTWWREWVLRCGRILLYATYCCDASEKGTEDAVIDSILDSLCAHEEHDGDTMPDGSDADDEVDRDAADDDDDDDDDDDEDT